MRAKDIFRKLQVIFTGEDMDRIQSINFNGGTMLVVDVHGLNKPQTRRLLNNIIAAVRTDFVMLVIHGFNHGQALQGVCRQELNSTKIRTIEPINHNPGRTVIRVAHAW